MSNMSTKPTASKFSKLNAALTTGDLRQIGKDFLSDLRDLTVEMLKPVLNGLLKGVGYAVTRSLDREKLAQDIDAVRLTAKKGFDNFRAACAKGFSTLKGIIKQEFSNLRAKNIEKVHNKHLANVLRRVEGISDPAIKEHVSREIKSFTSNVARYTEDQLNKFKEAPLHQKPESPLSDIKSLNNSVTKGLARLVEVASKIDTIANQEVRKQLMKSFVSVYGLCGDTLQHAYDKLENPTAKDVAAYAEIGFKAEKLLAKAVKNAVDLYHHAESKGLSNAADRASELIAKFGVSLNDKLIDGKLSSSEVVELTKEVKAQIAKDVKSKKVLGGLLEKLGELSAEDKAALAGVINPA